MQRCSRSLLQGNSTPSLSLKTLHFYNNMSGDGGGEHVARLVKRCSDLEDCLGSTRCLEKGGTALGLALGTCTKLRFLDLADNAFNLKGAKAVASSIRNMPKLEVLNLADLYLYVRNDCAVQLRSRQCKGIVSRIQRSW